MKGKKVASENKKLHFQEIEKYTYATIVCSDTQICCANKAAVKLLNFENADQLLNGNFLDLSSPIQANGIISKEDLKEKQAEACEKGIVNFDWILQTAKGRLIPIEVFLSPLNLSGEQFFNVVMRNLKCLYGKNEGDKHICSFDMVFSNIHDIALVGYDENRKVTFWNKTSEKNYGYTCEEAIGNYLEDLIVPENKREGFISAINDFFKKDIHIPSAEFTFKSKNNLPVDAFSSYVLVQKRGEGRRGYCINFDISKGKRTEKLQHVLQTITHAVNSTKSLEKLIRLVQKELGAIIDTTHFYIALHNLGSETIDVPFLRTDKVKFEFVPMGMTLSSYVLKTRRPLLAKGSKLSQLLKSGDIKMLEPGLKTWLGIPLKVKKKLIGVMAMQSFTDENAYCKDDLKFLKVISHEVSIAIERIKADEELKVALENAQESDRLKSAFLANMSHEIRTPMNGILGFLKLLNKPNITTENINRYTGIMNQSGQRLLETINDILDISRIESGQVQVDLKEININKIVNDLFVFFEEQTSSKKLIFELHKGLDDDDFVIISDQLKIESILTNLIKNAVKFTDSGRIDMGYKIANSELCFFVRDTGIGIRQDYLNSIFNRFEQVASGGDKVQQGSGLGLAISKSYVDMLKGKMWVKSKIRYGSEFYFTIPLKRPKNKSNVFEEYIDKAYVQPNILIVENDSKITLLLEEILDGFANTITCVNTGLEAIVKCREDQTVDLILMNVDHADIDGFETISVIRECHNSVVVLAMIDATNEFEKEKALKLGFDGILSKPISRVEVLESVAIFLKNKSAK